jgi:hypothetical protein
MVDKEICETNHKHINERLDRLEKRVDTMERIHDAINKLTLEIQKNVLETKQLRVEMNGVIADVNTLKLAPAKKYEELMKYILFTIVGLILGFIFFTLGLK